MKFSGKGIYAAILSLALTVSFVVTACGCEKKIQISVSTAKLVEIQLSGCDGHGKADFVLNRDNVKAEADKYKENENYENIYLLLDTMKFRMADEKQQGNLSNGQDFTVIADYNETLAASIKVDIKDTELICTAKNLTDGQELNAFQNLKVTFSGENGSGKITIDNSKCSKNTKAWIEFTADKTEKLKNGDTVKITAKPKVVLEEEGFYLKEPYRAYTVKNLLGARSSLKGINTESLREEMNKEMKTKILNSYYVTDYDYIFSSGKNRELNSEYFNYKSKYELDSYQYIYNKNDLNENSLIAYYKVTTKFTCKAGQAGLKAGFTPMKEGETDNGTTYVAIMTNPLRIGKDNQLDKDNYIYFDSANGKTIKDIQTNLSIGKFSSEFFDKEFSLTNKTEPVTEKPTQTATQQETSAD